LIVADVPAKMFNSDVTCDILMGFIRTSFARDVDDASRQRMVKIGIDLEGIKRELMLMESMKVEESHEGEINPESLSRKPELEGLTHYLLFLPVY